MITYQCGMDQECVNQGRFVGIIYTETGAHGILEKAGTHPTYEDAQKCVHSKEPAALKRLGLK